MYWHGHAVQSVLTLAAKVCDTARVACCLIADMRQLQ